jgi:hypothetical protein
MNAKTADNVSITFNDKSFDREDLNSLSGPELVILFNRLAAKLPGMNTIKRFADKKAALKRTWDALNTWADLEVQKEPAKVPAPVSVAPRGKEKPTQAPEAKKAPKVSRGTNVQPAGHAPLPCREGSKQAMLLDVLARPGGATMEELLDALSGGKKPWLEVTVRAGFSWDMKNKGYGVYSSVDEDGKERFYIVLPMHQDTGKAYPIPAHVPLKTSKPKADARQTKLPV